MNCKARVVLIPLLAFCFVSESMEKQVAKREDSFKEIINAYITKYGNLSDFPLYEYFEDSTIIKIALENGVKPDIHTLSNALEINNISVITLLLNEDSSLANDCFFSYKKVKGQGIIPYTISSERSSYTVLQYAVKHLHITIFGILLAYNPDITITNHRSKLPKKILKARMDESEGNSNDYYKASIMLTMFKEYKKKLKQNPVS
jgi:hypothetical protein